MLAIAVADVKVDGDFQFERRQVGATPIDLRRLAEWLVEHEVDEVVMESTASRGSRARSILPKRNRIVALAGARGTPRCGAVGYSGPGL